MQQWEYWAETLYAEGGVKKNAAALNVRGREGWELISAVPYVSAKMAMLVSDTLTPGPMTICVYTNARPALDRRRKCAF
jgi:hypothetical protein